MGLFGHPCDDSEDKSMPLASRSADATEQSRFQVIPIDDRTRSFESSSVGLNGYPESSFPILRSFPPPVIETSKRKQLYTVEADHQAVEVGLAMNHILAQGDDVYEDVAAWKTRQQEKQRFRRLLLVSNLLFVAGSALYLSMAAVDLSWAKEAQSIPESVLLADDDVTWIEFRLQEDGQATEPALLGPAWTANINATTTTSDTRQPPNLRRRLTLYDDYDWDQLPPEVQSAAKTLGYSSTSWDNDLWVFTNDLSWNELTEAQQKAAITLGYDPISWDDGGEDNDDSTPAPTPAPTPSRIPAPPMDKPLLAEEATTATTSTVVPNLPYENVAWQDLDDDAWEAAKELGYNKFRWENDFPPKLVSEENPSWDELTKSQREAAQILGYSSETWWYIRRNYQNFEVPIDETQTNEGDSSSSGLMNAATAAATQQPNREYVPLERDDDAGAPDNTVEEGADETAATVDANTVQEGANVTAGDDDANTVEEVANETAEDDDGGDDGSASTPILEWDDYYWEDLPQDVKDAYQILGWNESMWDGGGSASTESLTWEDLSPEQQEAALFLGYSRTSWDGIDWENYDWNDLPMEVKLAFRVLGYDETIWNEGGEPLTSHKYWNDLTATEQAAAVSVGYTEEIWNSETTPTEGEGTTGSGATDSLPETVDDPAAEWYVYSWNELPPEVQIHFVTLGYDQQLWDNDGVAFTEDMAWGELTPEQQVAATSLGYTQAMWDGTTVTAMEAEAYESEDDDYVFLVASRDVWVSRYQIQYFVAALCFVLVGMVDWFREHKLFHIFMILAGLFGLVSAMLIETHRTASVSCNLASVYCFLFEGLNVMKYRLQSRNPSHSEVEDETSSPEIDMYSDLWWIPTVESTADFFFVAGALMDVVLGHFEFERSSEWNMALTRVWGFSTLLWMACSLLYLLVTLVVYYDWFACGRSKRPRHIEVEPTSEALQDMKVISVAPLAIAPTMSMNSVTSP